MAKPLPASAYRCTACGEKTEILETRGGSFGYPLRRRSCVVCGNRFTTLEIEIPARVLLKRKTVKQGNADWFGAMVRGFQNVLIREV